MFPPFLTVLLQFLLTNEWTHKHLLNARKENSF